MAALIRPLPRRFRFSNRACMASTSPLHHLQLLFSPCVDNKSAASCFTSDSTFKITRRNYISEMRKAAFEGNMLRLIRNEIQYEHDRSPPQQVSISYSLFLNTDELQVAFLFFQILLVSWSLLSSSSFLLPKYNNDSGNVCIQSGM